MVSNDDLDRLGVEFEQRTLRDHGADRALDVALRQIVSLRRLRIQCFQHAPRRVAAVARSGDGDVIAARIDHDAEPAFDQRQVLSVGSDQRRDRAIVVEVDDDLRFGRNLHVAVKFAAGSERRRIRCAFWQGFRLPWSFEEGGQRGMSGSRRRRGGRRREFAEQAVALEACNRHRQHLSDDIRECHHMRRLQIGGAADDLAGIARGAFEQHIDGVANRSPLKADCWLSINS